MPNGAAAFRSAIAASFPALAPLLIVWVQLLWGLAAGGQPGELAGEPRAVAELARGYIQELLEAALSLPSSSRRSRRSSGPPTCPASVPLAAPASASSPLPSLAPWRAALESAVS